jgi:cell wall-associated NlpC family hydrolase
MRIKNELKPSQDRPGAGRIARLMQTGTFVIGVLILTGCASSTQSDPSAWLEPRGNRTAALDIDNLDPITAIAASQHPLARSALEHLGVNYRFGGTSPSEGFDCSGLIHYSAENSLGLRLPRRAADMASVGLKVDRPELAVGDLVFFNTLGRRYSHVGVYLGNNLFVHAPSSGGEVRVANMTNRYWAQRYNGARRLDPILLADRMVNR